MKDLEAKHLKNVDVAHANQVSEDNRDALCSCLDCVVGLLHKAKPGNCPFRNWKEVPGSNICHMDEMGTDSTKH